MHFLRYPVYIILQVRKLRPREVKEVTWHFTVGTHEKIESQVQLYGCCQINRCMPPEKGHKTSYFGLWSQGKQLGYLDCSSRKLTSKLGDAFQISVISLVTWYRSAILNALIFIIYLLKVIYGISLRIISTLSLLLVVLFSITFIYI